MPTPEDLEALHRSDQRAVRTVDSLTDEEWASPSLLPGWSRAHVVAHLALNAEGFAGALEGLTDGEVVPIYPSNDARDAAIAGLADAEHDEIRQRFFAATEHFRRIVEDLDAEAWTRTVLRTPAGPEWPAAALVTARRREVEIHHADLAVEYSHLDWPADFTATLLDHVAASQEFSVTATDLGRTWNEGPPTVSGTAAALAWWLIGRGDDGGLSCDAGALPQPGPWQRPAR